MKKDKDNLPQGSPASQTEKTEKKQGNQLPKKNGGARPGAGRKPLADRVKVQTFREMIEEDAEEDMEIVETNRATGSTQVKKLKSMKAIMQMLKREAIKNNNVIAAREYLDRVLGKANQPIDHSGGVKVEQQYLPQHPKLLEAEAAFYEAIEDDDDE